jgi:uncharacterized protein YndB with AHSA1/START domain
VAPIMCDVAIARPPDEVFGYVTDPSRFGEWQAGVVRGALEGDGPPQVGSHLVMTRRLGGSQRTSTMEITEIAPPGSWASHGIDGPVRADVRVRVDPVDDGQGSHVTIQLDFHGHGIGKVLMPMVVRQARREAPENAGNLKKRLEGSHDQ